MVNSEAKRQFFDSDSVRANLPRGTKIQSSKNTEKLNKKPPFTSDKTPLPHNPKRPGLLRSPDPSQQFQNQSYATRFQQAPKVHQVSQSSQPLKTLPQPNSPHFRQQKLPNKSQPVIQKQPLQNVQTPKNVQAPKNQQLKTQVSEAPEEPSRDASDSKSPMAAINDLARYNKLVALYELIATQGPPHSRKFAVRLTLNDQSWICEDTSIRKAQHACAAEAIEKCTLPKPLAKEFRKHQPKGGTVELNEKAMTDTVKLNTLASKFGFKINYSLVSRKVLGEVETELNDKSKENKKPERIVSWAEITEKAPIPETARKLQASTGQRPPMEYTVAVEILTPENLKFTGIGSNQQAARHRAASLALGHFSALFENHRNSADPKQNVSAPVLPEISSQISSQIPPQTPPPIEISPQIPIPSAIITSAVPNFGVTRDKSSITLVYEMAARRKMPVVYETVDNFSEKGKSRRKTYGVKLTVGPSTLEDPGDFRGRVFLGQATTTSKQEAKRMASSDVMNKMMADLSPLDKELQVKEKKVCTAPVVKNIEKEETEEKCVVKGVEKGVGSKLEKSVGLLERKVEEMIDDLNVPLTKMVLKEGDNFKRMQLDKKVIGKVKSQPSKGNLHRSVNLNVDSTSQNFGLHPVSRLSQLIQLKKLRDPVYEVIIEPINKRSGFRTFCRVTDEHGTEHVGEDLGVNKKDSKKLATVQVLKSMGFDPSTNALKTNPSLQPIIRTNDSESRLENHPVTITQSSPIVLNKSSKKLAKKQLTFQTEKQFKMINQGDGVLEESSKNEESSENSKNKSVSKNSVAKNSVSESKSIESDTFIGKLENMKTEGKVLKISYKNSQRKSGGYLTILTVTLASGKPILLHNLGATSEEASEVAAKKAIAEILKKEAKGDQEDSDEDDSDEDSDDE